ncbi:cytochrome P450 4C1 isoform X2 [Anabrus simplex]|uniref:cytochrome P450 4C1 isoform X2 n=1 Tax=Anabrus simplex TaxID=316456 RepID=UPI0035A2CC83
MNLKMINITEQNIAIMLEMCLLLLVIVLVLHITLPYRWMPAEFYKHLHKIPGPKGYPIIGNTLIALAMRADDVYNLMKSYTEKYGPILRIYGFGLAHVMISDHEIIEAILTGTQNISKASDYRLLSCWLRDGLLLSTGEKWHTRRKMLTPAFHFKILEDYIPVFSRNSKILVNKLWEYIDEPFVRVNKLITLCTLDIICETAMGTSIHAQDGQEVEYVKAVHRISELFQKRQLNPFLYKNIIFNLTGIGREQARVVKILHAFTRKVLEQRRQEYISNRETTDNNLQRKKRILSFLDLLIEISETKQVLSDEDIQEEVDTFMFEEKVMHELDSIFGNSDRDPTYEDLSHMKYLEQVIKETLRLYPSVPVMSRMVEKDIHIKGYTIPVGAHATMLTFMLHRNPELYPEPEKFDPARFSPESCQKRHPFAYVPFSAGPRSCIGQKFALMEAKVVLSTVLRNFKLETLDRPEDVKVLMEIVIKPKEPFCIRFTPRR